MNKNIQILGKNNNILVFLVLLICLFIGIAIGYFINENGRYAVMSERQILEYGAMGLEMKKYHKTLVLDTFYQGVKPLCIDENVIRLEHLLIGIKESYYNQ